MKQKFVYLILVSAMLGLAACQSATTSANSAPERPKKSNPPQDFLDLGRDFSKGTVDLYRPGSDFLPDLGPIAKRREPLSPIPGNTNIFVNDPSVIIYSLDTILVGEVDAMPLPPPTPIGLPELQPPILTAYPSPFEDK